MLDKSEMPDFDEQSGLIHKEEDDEEDLEIELVEDEAPFLKVRRYLQQDPVLCRSRHEVL